MYFFLSPPPTLEELQGFFSFFLWELEGTFNNFFGMSRNFVFFFLKFQGKRYFLNYF